MHQNNLNNRTSWVKVQNFQYLTFKLVCLSTLLEIGMLKHTSNPFLTLSGDLFRSKPTVCGVSGSFSCKSGTMTTTGRNGFH